MDTVDDARSIYEVCFKVYKGTHNAIEGLVEAHGVEFGVLDDCAIQAFEDEGEALPSSGSRGILGFSYLGIKEAKEAVEEIIPPWKRSRIGTIQDAVSQIKRGSNKIKREKSRSNI